MARGFPPEESAKKAGFPAKDCGARCAELLLNAKIRRKVTRLSHELAFCTPGVLARAGLERLALADTAGDVARLISQQEEPSLEKADLFSVAEIKRPKGGGIEVKFYDRLRALSLLAELDGGKQETAGSLLKALEQSAASIGGDAGNEQL